MLTEITNIIYENGPNPNQMKKTVMIKIPKIEGTLKFRQHEQLV